MKPAISPRLSDPARVAALHATGLLGSPPEASFDRLTRLACRTVRTPAAMLSLVGSEHQFVKSSIGLSKPWIAGGIVPTTQSICRYVIARGKPVLIHDAQHYRRLRENPVVQATDSRSYLGVPLRSEEGTIIGTLCAIDRIPRTWNSVDVENMQDLAAVATVEVEARRRQLSVIGSEERFRLATRATSDVLWEWDLVSGEIRWSEAAYRTFRYAPHEMKSESEWWYERIHPDDRERVVSGIQEAISGIGESWTDEYRFRRGDGSDAAVLDRTYVARDERRTAVRMIGWMIDVTERRRAEDGQRFLSRASVLLDSSLQYESAFASLAHHVVPAMADLCLVHVVDENNRLRRVTVAHAGHDDMLDGQESLSEDTASADNPVLKAVRSGKPVLVRNGNGNLAHAIGGNPRDRDRLHELGLRSLLTVPLISHDRTLGAITLGAWEPGRQYGPIDLVMAEDLARRAAVSLENCLLYAKAQQAVRARDEVLGVVSHDLRNPLSAIDMAAAMLLETGTERRVGKLDALELIRRSARQMSTMIKDLLDASSMDAGRFRARRSVRSIRELLSDVQTLLQPLADAKHIRLLCEPAETAGSIYADADQILRVFSNLIGNAIKFSPANSDIRIDCRPATTSGEVVFTVTDAGPGIPNDQVTHVFDRYWQGMRGDRRGAGLGLAIAKGVVEAHDGRIWVNSTPGKGTSFSFALPVAETATAFAA